MRRNSSRVQKQKMSSTVVGVIGTTLIILTVLIATRFNELSFVKGGIRVDAEFAEAGGLEVKDEVLISGAPVGRVESISLERGRVVVGLRITDSSVQIGEQSDGRIVTTTLLGHAAVEIIPKGPGQLEDASVIPLARTSSPYDITAALADLTTEVTEIDVEQLSESLSTVSETFRDSPDELKAALEGIDQVAGTIASNDEVLRNVLDSAANVSEVLADRDKEISGLLGAGQSLLAEFNSRQKVIVQLLDSATELTDQLKLLVAENTTELKPALDELNEVVALLNKNKANLEQAITGLSSYSLGFGEAVSSGPFFDAYIQNLTSPGTVAPILSEFLQ